MTTMERIATGPLERDREKFLTLLTAARDAADEDGHWKIVSVSLASKAHIDPLAVLESIYEGEARHFYLEHPERDAALAGAEAVVEGSDDAIVREKAKSWLPDHYQWLDKWKPYDRNFRMG